MSGARFTKGVFKSLRAGFCAAVILLVAALAWAVDEPKKSIEKPHGSKDPKNCSVCHSSLPTEVQSAKKEFNLKQGGDFEKLCGTCHSGYKHMHPVKIAVAPDMRNPEDLPLDKDGKITCITCHSVMDGSAGHLKRRLTGKLLCLNCHTDSDIIAQVVWYPTTLKTGQSGRLEMKIVEFKVGGQKQSLGKEVLLYYYAKDVDSGTITFGTNVLRDDGTVGDRKAGDGIYTLLEKAVPTSKRVVYTCWVLDVGARRSNTVTLAIEYTK